MHQLRLKNIRVTLWMIFSFFTFNTVTAQTEAADTTSEKLPIDTTYYYYRYDTVPRHIPVEVIFTADAAAAKTPVATAPLMMPMAIHSHIPTSVEPDHNKNIGEIPIQENVSATGGLTYNVPIQLIPGRATLPVSLGITYSSHGGAGFLGYGWSLSGLSMIQEVSTNIYYNTKTEPLKLTKAGQFVLDGMRLIKLSENTTQVTYQSEQGNVKATAYLNGNIVKYFSISYPNGNTAIYGYETNATQRLYYPITRLEDLHGNRIQYSYSLSNEQYYISKIEYGGTSSVAHYASVEFSYTIRTDINTHYSAGRTILNNFLLSSISCKSSGTTLRTYSFTYQYDNNTALLQKIDCSAGGSNLNPLQFYYGNGPTTAQLVKTTTQLTNWFSGNPSVVNLKVSKGKFDYGTENDGVIVYPNLNPYSYQDFQYINLFSTSQKILVYQGLAGSFSSPNEVITGTGFVDMFSANIDGKYEEEVIKINNFKNGTQDRVEFKIYKPNLYYGLALYATYTFDLGNLIRFSTFWTPTVHPKYFYSGDFNGDGKMEILAVSCHNALGKSENPSKTYIFDLEAGIKRHESTGLNFKIDYTVTSGVNDDLLFPVDVDGDGKTDIIHIHDNRTDIYTFDISGTTYARRLVASNSNLKKADVKFRQLAIGDLNADGLPDILISPRESYYYTNYVTVPVYAPRYCSNGHHGTYNYGYCSTCNVYMSQSNYCYECYSYLNNGSCPTHGTSVSVPVTEYIDNGNTWSIHYCKGNGTLEKKTFSFKNLEQNEKIMLQDVNGDHFTDVVSTRGSTVYTYLVTNGDISTSVAASIWVSGGNYVVPSHVGGAHYHSQLISLNGGQVDKLAFSRHDGKQRLVTGMVNSLGVVSKTDYRLINEGITQYGNSSNWYTQGSGATFPYLNYQGPITVVTEKEQWLKDVQTGHTRYRYENAIVHLQGLGLTGFGKVYITNEKKGQTLTKTYDPLRYGILTKEQSPQAVVDYVPYFSIASNRIAKIWVTQKTENDLLLGTMTAHTYTYDTYGNLISEVNDFGGGLKTTTTNTITNTTGTPYVLGVISSSSIQTNRGGTSVTVKNDYTYNAQYRLLSKTTKYNNNTTSTEEWLYDAYGNVTQERQKAYSAANWLTTQYQYGASGRFMTKKINPLSQATDYVFATNGTLTSEKDFKNNTTSYEYDNWQRLKEITHPDGTIKNITLEWHAAGSERLYTQMETFTGSGPVREHYDGLNRKVRSSVVGFDGIQVLTDYTYDTHGRLYKTSLPYKSGTPLWETRLYDLHDRPTQITAATGAVSSFTYSGNSVTETRNNVSTTKTSEATGKIISVINPAGTISYSYRPDGQVSSITAPGSSVTTFAYDAFGRQTQITDPSAGTVIYTYDAAGNRNSVKDANNKTISSTFDAFNRLTGKTSPEFNTTYSYNSDGWIDGVTNTNGSSKTFTYDNLGRVIQSTETVGSESYPVSYTYTNGKLSQTVHAAVGYTINYLYNTHGYLFKLTNAGGAALKTINKMTSFGQVEETLLGNGLVQTHTFNSYGLLTGIKTMNGSMAVQNMTYTVDNLKGNISSRKDETRNLTENFTYDELDRLLSYGTTAATQTNTYHNATGNITGKSDVGTYKYTISGKPYAMSSVTVTSGNTIPTQLQEVSHTSFARPNQLKESNLIADFTYDEKYERVKQEFKTSGNLTWTRYYFNGGQYEKTVQGSSVKSILYLDGSPYTATVALESNNGTTRLLYINRDHLGSITHITDPGKVLQAEYSYDAWGRMRNPADLTVYTLGADPTLLLNRGYTGHEHAKDFGLVNMNARLYDPLVGRMLSPDNYVQAPENPMNFNRYSYAMNNPMKYTDPSGNFLTIWIVGFVKGVFNKENPWRRADTEVRNAHKINNGLFISDQTKDGWGRFRDIVSRFTWQGIQTVAGLIGAHAANSLGTVTDVDYYRGATVVTGMNDGLMWGGGGNGITLGSYIIGDRDIAADPNNALFQHEYGHYLQSQKFGFSYLTKIGIPNLYSRGNHDLHPTEQDANSRAFTYFNSNDPGFIWSFRDNPIRGYNQALPFDHPTNQRVLNRHLISSLFVDYLPFFYGNWSMVYYTYLFNSNQ